jgi:hypothetical protein
MDPLERGKKLAPAVRIHAPSCFAVRRSVVQAVGVQAATRIEEAEKGQEGCKELKHSFSLPGSRPRGLDWPCSASPCPKCPLQTT